MGRALVELGLGRRWVRRQNGELAQTALQRPLGLVGVCFSFCSRCPFCRVAWRSCWGGDHWSGRLCVTKTAVVYWREDMAARLQMEAHGVDSSGNVRVVVAGVVG